MAPAPVDNKTRSSDDLSTHATLSASYKNSSMPASTTRHFSLPMLLPIPAAGSGFVKKKAAYLSKLRTSTKQLQEEINVFLTQKMEEDKLRVVMDGGNGEEKVPGENMDEAEEENYGEEGVEDDEEG